MLPEAGKSLPDPELPELLDRSLRQSNEYFERLLKNGPTLSPFCFDQANRCLRPGMERFIETLDGAFSGGGTRPGFGYNPDDPNRWELPDAASLTRAKEILDILRERSSDSTRPIFEREYFERLLKRF